MWIGDISARYMGARPVFSPEFIPIRNRPTIIISYELQDFDKPKDIIFANLVRIC